MPCKPQPAPDIRALGVPVSKAREPVSKQSFGVRLTELRKSRGLSQRDIATAVGVTAACVCGWELDRSKPRYPAMEKLAALLETHVIYLLTGEKFHGQPAPPRPRTRSELIMQARRDVAQALGVEVRQVRIIVG